MRRRTVNLTCIVVAALGGSACMRSADEAAPAAQAARARDELQKEEAAFAPGSPAMEEAPKGGGGAMGAKVARKKKIALDAIQVEGRGGEVGNASGVVTGALGGIIGDAKDAPAQPAEAGGAASEATPARAWFPETFLFEPLVPTDETGHAKVTVRVPDRLTTWRILALAHSREGAQAGTETSFLGTLPAYVDPVVPAFLVAGDEVQLPVQVVNTTEGRLQRALSLSATGAALTKAAGTVDLAPSSSKVEYATLRANRPGEVVLVAKLAGEDQVERRFPVHPSGRPVSERAGGTLAAPRTVELALPADADLEATRVRLLVFPGALAIVRAELQAALGRGGLADDAYGLRLAGRAEKLLQALGGEVDPQALRQLSIVLGQRVLRAARSPSALTAALLADAALVHPESPVLSRLGERLVETIAREQRPDGTFEGGSGWTLQRLMVTTALCVRAARAGSEAPGGKARAARVTLAAEGAFERNLERIDDGYTAAAIVASGAVQGSLAERLRKHVKDELRADPSGTRSLPVKAGVVRADGTPPSEVEATALAVLALAGDQEAAGLVADLGARLLAAYDPARGFGDGMTNLVALDAVLALFKDPLPAKVTVTLAADDRVLASGELEGAKLKETLALDAPLPRPGGKHTFRITAEPAVPGLGYSLTARTWVPWTKELGDRGLELAIEAPKEVRVGRPADVAITANAPAGQDFTVESALPAGVEPDGPSLDALVSSGAVASYERQVGRVRFHVSARQPGQTFAVRYRVIPTLAGTLKSGPSSLELGASTAWLPPATWTIR